MTTYTVSNEETGERLAGFELTWSNGIEEELSEPVAVCKMNRPKPNQSQTGPGLGVLLQKKSIKITESLKF